MAEIITLKEFLKPSYEAIEREKVFKQCEQTNRLFKMLEKDGANVAKALIDFLAKAFVGIADGATDYEYHRIFEEVEVYVNVKKRGQE